MKKTYCLATLCLIFFLMCGCTLPVSNSLDGNTTAAAQTTGESAALEEETTGQISVDALEAADSTAKTGENAPPATQNTTMICLYYQDREGTLIPVTRVVRKQEALARLAVTGLIDSAVNREELKYYGLYPVLPKGTEVIGISLRDGNAAIEFNDQLLNYTTAAAERRIVSSIVYTLTEFKTIKNVKILIKGRSVQRLAYDTDISGFLNRGNLLINGSSIHLPEGSKKLDAYVFKPISEKFTCILPISVEFKEQDKETMLKKLVSLLQQEKPFKGVFSQFPAKTALLSCKQDGKVLSLDFSKELRGYGGTARELALVRQILFTAAQWEGTEQVRVTIEGQGDYLPEGTEIGNPLAIPKEINNLMDTNQ